MKCANCGTDIYWNKDWYEYQHVFTNDPSCTDDKGEYLHTWAEKKESV
jgi:hypothetical protein